MDKDLPFVHSKITTNVGTTERALSAAAGLWLMGCGLSGNRSLLKTVAGSYLLFRGYTGYCYGYDLIGKADLPDAVKNINIRTSIIVNRPRQEVYNFWRKLENLPLFMKHLKKVETIDGLRSQWSASLPGGVGSINWEAEIVKDEPGYLLGWSSLPGSNIENAGKVEFLDAEYGTELNVTITYRPPLKALGAGIAKLFNSQFEKLVEKDIRGFKAYMESSVSK